MPVFTYGSETMIWKEKERSMIRDAQMDNLRGFLEIRRMNKTLNAWIRKLCRVRMKGLRKVFSNSSAMWRE